MKKANEKSVFFMTLIFVLISANLIGCTDKNNLFTQMIQLIEEDEMIQFNISSNCEPYNSEDEFYEIAAYQADLANVKVLLLPDEVQEEYQTIEDIISKQSEIDDELLDRKRDIDAVLNQNLIEINQYHDELSDRIVSVLENMRIRNKENFEVIKGDEVVTSIQIEYSDGRTIQTEFYQSGQLMIRTGKRSVTTFTVNEKEVYEYSLDDVYEIGDLLKEYNYWLNGPGKLINEYHVLHID